MQSEKRKELSHKYENIIEPIFNSSSGDTMAMFQSKKGFIIDFDTVVSGESNTSWVKQFIEWASEEGKSVLFITNNSAASPVELRQQAHKLEIEIPEVSIFSSAQSTALFLASQKAHGTAYVLGETGLFNSLYNVGYTMNSVNPDYVIVGESTSHNYEKIAKAVDLVRKGAKLIGTNSDSKMISEGGIVSPSTGAFVAAIQAAAERTAYFLGKSNPITMRQALNLLHLQNTDVALLSDRMEGTIAAGIEAGVQTVMVLNGRKQEEVEKCGYSASLVVNGFDELIPEWEEEE